MRRPVKIILTALVGAAMITVPISQAQGERSDHLAQAFTASPTLDRSEFIQFGQALQHEIDVQTWNEAVWNITVWNNAVADNEAAQAAQAAKSAQHPRTEGTVGAAATSNAQQSVYSDDGGLPAGLICIRDHESGGNYGDSTGNGYYGAYQYSWSTWAGYGGYANPASAPPSVQDERALSDYNMGTRQIHQNWPQTSRMCGL